MNRLFTLLLLFMALSSFSQVIVLEGRYQGKNIYITDNAVKGDTTGCTEKILVNGKELHCLKGSAYEIPLNSLGLKAGDSLKVEIFHKAGCSPKVLNTAGCMPKSTFELVSISVDSSAVLHWVSKNEEVRLTYTIEQFHWNKWIKIGEVDGKGGIRENAYSFQTLPHSGKNTFRVKQVDATGISHCSRSIDYLSDIKKVTFKPGYETSQVELSAETDYEVYDQWGDIVKKGRGKTIDIRDLKKGNYYLNFDDSMSEFIKP